MRWFLVALFALLAGATVGAAEPDSEEMETPTPAPPWGPGLPDPASARSGSLASWAWLAAWAALAGVVGLVVVSSLAKTRPVPGDPLVTAPGVPVARARRGASPFVPVPHRAAFDAGRDLAFRASPASPAHALELASALGLGEGVLFARASGARVVRFADCSSCRARTRERRWARARRAEDACGFEEGFLTGAFEVATGRAVAVKEVRCGAGRDGVCEFEIA